MELNDFLFAAHIDTHNLFKITRYLTSSRIIPKARLPLPPYCHP